MAASGLHIVVTLNYRLGILGFMSTGDSEAPGNYALLDIISSLKWIQNNIGDFGGDKNRVTILGHGYGAALANLVAISAPVKGKHLFSGLILQSGTAHTVWATVNDPVSISKKVAENLHCFGKNTTLLPYPLRPQALQLQQQQQSHLQQPYPQLSKLTSQQFQKSQSFPQQAFPQQQQPLNFNFQQQQNSELSFLQKQQQLQQPQQHQQQQQGLEKSLHSKIVSCLKQAPLKDLLAAFPHFNAPFSFSNFGPVVDGTIIPRLPFSLQLGLEFGVGLGLAMEPGYKGHAAVANFKATYLDPGVNVMLGYTLGEGMSFFSQEVFKNGTGKASMENYVKNIVHSTYHHQQQTIMDILLHGYRNWERGGHNLSAFDARDDLFELVGDAFFASPANQLAAFLSIEKNPNFRGKSKATRANKSFSSLANAQQFQTGSLRSGGRNSARTQQRNVYFYCFNLTRNGPSKKPHKKPLQGLGFGGDLMYTFVAPLTDGVDPFPTEYDPDEKMFNVAMLEYWRNFIHTGSPNNKPSPELLSMPLNTIPLTKKAKLTFKSEKWLPFDTTNRLSLVLEKDKIKMESFYRAPKMSVWSILIPKLIHSSIQQSDLCQSIQSFKSYNAGFLVDCDRLDETFGKNFIDYINASSYNSKHFNVRHNDSKDNLFNVRSTAGSNKHVQNDVEKSLGVNERNQKDSTFLNDVLKKADTKNKADNKTDSKQPRNLPLVVVIGVGCVLLSGNIFLFVAVYFRRKKKGRRKQCVAVSGASGGVGRAGGSNGSSLRSHDEKAYLSKNPTSLCNENTNSMCRFEHRSGKGVDNDDNNNSSINNLELKLNYYNHNTHLYDPSTHERCNYYETNKKNVHRNLASSYQSQETISNNANITTSLLNFDNDSTTTTTTTLDVNPSLNTKLFYQVNANTRFLPLSAHSDKLPYQHLQQSQQSSQHSQEPQQQQQFQHPQHQLQHYEHDLVKPRTLKGMATDGVNKANSVADDHEDQINYFSPTKEQQRCSIHQPQKQIYINVNTSTNPKIHPPNNKASKSNSNFSTSFSIATIFPSEPNKLPTISSSTNRSKQHFQQQQQQHLQQFQPQLHPQQLHPQQLHPQQLSQQQQQPFLQQHVLSQQDSNNDSYSDSVTRVLSSFDSKQDSVDSNDQSEDNPVNKTEEPSLPLQKIKQHQQPQQFVLNKSQQNPQQQHPQQQNPQQQHPQQQHPQQQHSQQQHPQQQHSQQQHSQQQHSQQQHSQQQHPQQQKQPILQGSLLKNIQSKQKSTSSQKHTVSFNVEETE